MSDGYIPNDSLIVSICVFRPAERTEIMGETKTAPRIPLFSERKEPEKQDLYIYGSENTAEKEQDCFAKALSRYMSDSGPDNKKVSARKLHILSGVSKSAIYYYLLGVRRITYETLCAICIALRLHPVRQEHLFRKAHIMMPCDEPYPSKRDRIIKYYLDNCAFIERCTVIACNGELTANDCDALNELTSDKEDSE